MIERSIRFEISIKHKHVVAVEDFLIIDVCSTHLVSRSFLRRHARVRGHVLKWGINNVLRKVVLMVRKTWRSYSFFPFSADNLFTIG